MGDAKTKRLYGVEDGSFKAFSNRTPSYTYLCCVAMVGNLVEGVQLRKIEVDGRDATEKLSEMLKDAEAKTIILGGITFAGFNIIDPWRILHETGVPVIVYSGKKPDNDGMLRALQSHFEDWSERWKIVESLGQIHSLETFPGAPHVYFEVVGCSADWAAGVLRDSALVSRIPEPVRVAGVIARGLSPLI
jgi:endonuclease V-like protein UPF0215 family